MELVQFSVAAAEILLLLCIAIGICFSVVYYGSTFVEERLTSFVRLVKGLAVGIMLLFVLLPTSRLPLTVIASVIVSNGIWAFLLFSGFPLISPYRPDFFLAIISSVFAHFFMFVHFLGDGETGGFLAAAYFVLFVWSLPSLMIVSLSAVEELPQGEAPAEQPPKKAQSVWRAVIARLLKRAEDVLPAAASKDT
jgi:hypothetical protein